MKNEINAVLENMTTTIPLRQVPQAERSLFCAG